MIEFFGIFLFLAVFFGGFIVWRDAGREGYPEERILDSIIIVAFASFFFSHLLFALLNQTASFESVVRFWQGGRLFYGAFFGGLLTFYYLTKRYNWSFFELADLAVSGVLLAQAVGSVGCVVGECGHATGYLETALYLLLYYLAINFEKLTSAFKTFSGYLFLVYLAMMGVSRLVVEYFREDFQIFNVYFSVALMFTAVVIFYKKRTKIVARGHDQESLDLFARGNYLTKNWRSLKMNRFTKAPKKYSKKFLNKMKDILQREEKELEEDLEMLEGENPFKETDRADDNAELIQESEEQEGYERFQDQKKVMRDALESVRSALTRIKEGTYGYSEESGEPIDEARLKANPTATRSKEEEERREAQEGDDDTPPLHRIS